MEIKCLGGVLILLGCLGVGVWFRMQYVHKLVVLKECCKGLALLQGEIQYGRIPLPEACQLVAARTKGSCHMLFQKVGKQLEQGEYSTEQIWRETMLQVMDKQEMKQQDREEMLRLGNTLGYLDLTLQYNTLELCIKRLEESRDCYEREKKNRMRLYPMMGTFAGLLICLVLV